MYFHDVSLFRASGKEHTVTLCVRSKEQAKLSCARRFSTRIIYYTCNAVSLLLLPIYYACDLNQSDYEGFDVRFENNNIHFNVRRVIRNREVLLICRTTCLFSLLKLCLRVEFLVTNIYVRSKKRVEASRMCLFLRTSSPSSCAFCARVKKPAVEKYKT